MSAPKVRRSVTLMDSAKADLERIKSETGASTDNAAINDALNFRAQFSRRRAEEVSRALSFYDKIRPELNKGSSLFLENPSKPDVRQELIFISID